MSTAVAKRSITPAQFLKSEAAVVRASEILGKEKAGIFISSLSAIVNSTPALEECTPKSVFNAALDAASKDLPLGMGLCAMVPFGDGKTGQKNVSFIIQSRGWLQLWMRTGQVKTLRWGLVKEGELKKYDRFSGDPVLEQLYEEGSPEYEKAKTIGYFAFAELANGFTKTIYLSVGAAMEHGKKYSKSYNNPKGFWKKDFDGMATKTAILKLKPYLPVSTRFQGVISDAINVDQAVYNDEGRVGYADNPIDAAVIESEIVEAEKNYKKTKEAKVVETKQSADNAPSSDDPAPTPEELDEHDEELADDGQEEDDTDWGADPGEA